MPWKNAGPDDRPEYDPHVHGAGEDAARPTSNPAFTRAADWRTTASNPGDRGWWVCTQCYAPGSAHKSLQCPDRVDVYAWGIRAGDWLPGHGLVAEVADVDGMPETVAVILAAAGGTLYLDRNDVVTALKDPPGLPTPDNDGEGRW